ncbi:MAG: YebC/PmpR family DNA-binding transcriptional regulator [Sphaerobacteraceae bacterium]|nr:MAG: YebC/PmpR family DNA-binding transcriptional regulator [Sphaerobacteraceae bacterium]
MAGHSKWSQIKRKKGVNDQKRGQLFTKLGREIAVAVREGGPKPEGNARLRLAIERAKRESMPSDNIERAIAKASGAGSENVNFETIFYEGYGPSGVAIMAIGLTENRNRTASEVRTAFNRGGGTLGETGCVAWQFDTVGQIVVPAEGVDPDEVAMMAIDAGATDVDPAEDAIYITTEPGALTEVSEQLEAAGLTLEQAEITRLPQNTIELDAADAQKTIKLMDALEDLDDIQQVFTNAGFPAEVEEAVA